MNDDIYNELKESLRLSILKYVSHKSYDSKHPLDALIPQERKIRSIVGGLETSMGTTIWEPLAKTLAKNNGFEIISEKILIPSPMPKELAAELAILISLRESKLTWIPIKQCVARLREICGKIDRSLIRGYTAPPSGTGVDIRLRKDGTEYAYDTKTVQPNLGSVKSFNKQILEWYAYALCKNPSLDIRCGIAYPYNPFEGNFWSHTPHTKGVLEHGVDAFVEDEFWDFLSGYKNTFGIITKCFEELADEGFGQEISELIKKI
ncbi:MjaII restriction endonuclease [Candidatus Saccharibacteria bacterium RAAC3_TM7_1]|nr:MjaII restriction endonuclease [Candidatus Saccharibacteria bacterium RAAC3_TM7_1]HCZ28194.1 TdeIII family type II restriction endonuclease [Candidatus Saccharibacteria bacterium]